MRIAKKVSFTQIGDTTILLDSATDKTYHELNPVGSIIWNGIVKNLRADKIAEKIQSEYDVSIDQATQDVNDFVNELAAKNVIEV